MLLGDPAAIETRFTGWRRDGSLSAGHSGFARDDHRLASGDYRRLLDHPPSDQLGYLPRLEVRHTSETEIGQVYVPRINWGLLVAVVVLVLGFQSSGNLGAAYGIAVSGMMAITTGLAFIYMRSQGWSLAVAVPVFACLRHRRFDLPCAPTC